MNGSIVFLRDDDPDEEAIVVDTDEGGTLSIPYGETGDAAARLRDLGPQGAGLRGAGRGRRLPPLARADADPAAALHRDHPRPQHLRPGRRPGGAGRRRSAATTAAAATPGWRSGCAAEPTRRRDTAAMRGRAATAPGRDRRSPWPGSSCWRRWCWRSPPCATPSSAAIQRRPRRGPRADRRPRRRRAAADPRPGPDPRRRLLPGRDRRRRRRLRLRLLPGAGPGDVRLAALGLLCYAVGRSVARPLLDRWFGAERFERIEAMIERGGVTLLIGAAPDPDRPLQPRLLRRRRRPGAALALRLDDGRRLPADHRALRLLRHPARGPRADRPAGARHGRGAARAAARRALDHAAPGRRHGASLSLSRPA